MIFEVVPNPGPLRYRILFVGRNGRILQERSDRVESVEVAADFIVWTLWPGGATVARVVDVDGSVAYEVYKSAIL